MYHIDKPGMHEVNHIKSTDEKYNKAFHNVSPNHPTLILCHQQISYLSFKAFLERVQRLAVHLEFRVRNMYHGNG